MKKLLLLSTLVCAGQMYGMESQEPMGTFAQLPKELLHQEIIKQAIESSNTLEEAIKAVKMARALSGVQYDNLKNFTKLVHLLADKFDTTTHEVANEFNTLLAKNYIQLGEQLLQLNNQFNQPNILDKDNIRNKIDQLINDGADVNFSTSIWDAFNCIHCMDV